MKKASEYDLIFSRKLKFLRKKYGIPPPELAECLNMSKSNYYKIERGERKITHGQFMVILEKTKITPDEFLSLCDFI